MQPSADPKTEILEVIRELVLQINPDYYIISHVDMVDNVLQVNILTKNNNYKTVAWISATSSIVNISNTYYSWHIDLCDPDSLIQIRQLFMDRFIK